MIVRACSGRSSVRQQARCGCAACGHQQHLRTQRARQQRPQRPGPPGLRSHHGRPAPATPPARAPASMRRPDPGQRLARWKRSRSLTTNTQTDTGTGDRRRPKTVPAMIGYPARRWRAGVPRWITVSVLLGDPAGSRVRGCRMQRRRRAGGRCECTGRVRPGYRSPSRRLCVSADRRGRGTGRARRGGWWSGHPAARGEYLVHGSAGPRTGSGG